MKLNTTSDVNTEISPEDLDNIYISEIKNGKIFGFLKRFKKMKKYAWHSTFFVLIL